MKTVISQLRDKLTMISDAFAIGVALDEGRITTAQASDAINQAGLRSDLRQLDRGARVDSSAAAAGELVEAR